MADQILGEGVPGFDLSALDGRRVTLDSALASKRGAVVVFWSGVCSHCRRYDAYLNGFGAAHGDLALVVVASRQDESAEDIRRTVAERRLTFKILHDADRRVARAWHVEQTPRVFLIDAERRLLYRGAIDNFKYPDDPEYRPYLALALADFLAGRPIERAETASFGCPVASVYYDIPKPLES